VSLAQLIEILHNLCGVRGSNPKYLISLHLIVLALVTRLLDKKKKIYICHLVESHRNNTNTILFNIIFKHIFLLLKHIPNLYRIIEFNETHGDFNE